MLGMHEAQECALHVERWCWQSRLPNFEPFLEILHPLSLRIPDFNTIFHF